MSDSNAEIRRTVREEFRRMGSIAGLFALAGICACYAFVLTFIVPKFAQIYADALPGRPLPLVTQSLIAHHFVYALITLGWPVVGFVLLQRQNRYAPHWIIGGLAFFMLVGGLTVIALFSPMVGTN